MEVIRSANEMTAFSERARSNGNTVGFVPTMGALHQGHASLVKKSAERNDYTVVSVFVNPTQFNDASDLETYPRTFEADQELLSDLGVQVMFYPSVEEVYPENEPKKYDLDGLDEIMEGPNRPGHFNGVVQVVTRLFDIVKPDNSYFGQKDFQQLAILKHMTTKLGYQVRIEGCPTIRESSGLAMSSRNMRLTDNDKEQALTIYKTLIYLRDNIESLGIQRAVRSALISISNNPAVELEYLELVEPSNLSIATDQSNEIQACIAAWVGGVRLIDNMRVK
jgi:pantoate--beta-alanine ligase